MDFLREHQAELVGAAERGLVPVSALSAKLLQRFGAGTMSARVTKQFCGLVTAALLGGQGFVVDRRGVRVRSDPIFSAGTVYKRVPVTQDDMASPVLKRVIDSLTEEELRWVYRYVQGKFNKGT